MKSVFKKIVAFLIFIILLVAIVVFNMRVKTETTPMARMDPLLTIEPSTKVSEKDGWLMYIKGARAVLVGENIKSAEVRAMPTGTGAGEEYPDGVLLGAMSKSTTTNDTWVFLLPPDILATNLFAVATDTANRPLRSDLGNVGYDADTQKAVDEGHQPWRIDN